LKVFDIITYLIDLNGVPAGMNSGWQDGVRFDMKERQGPIPGERCLKGMSLRGGIAAGAAGRIHIFIASRLRH